VQVLSGDAKSVKIINRYDHISLEHLQCHWVLVGDGIWKKGQEVKIPKNIKPGTTAILKIEGLTDIPSSECYLGVVFTLRNATNWGPAGHEVADGQIQLVGPSAFSSEIPKSIVSSSSLKCSQLSAQVLEIAGSAAVWKFNVVHGSLFSWKKVGSEMIHTPPSLNFYRAVTDNDFPARFGTSWLNSRLHQTSCHVKSVTWSVTSEQVTIMVTARVAPPVLEWSVETTFLYVFTNGQVSIKVNGTPRGNYLPNSFARIGLSLSLNDVDSATWFGRGPGESYRDKKRSQKIGTYTLPIEDLFVDYEFPQETSNRTDVRWVKFSKAGSKGLDGKEIGLKAHFGPLDGASFTALHYTTADLDKSQHPYELHKTKKEETIVRLDWAHHGLGTGSCGPATLPEYELKVEPFVYEILLE
jgi:beta-galactosidase